MSQLSFEAVGNFYDDENFPFGFHRSGDFTRKQAEQLTQLGNALKALYTGKREPVTAREQHFYDVFSGCTAITYEEERLWQQYLDAIARRNEYITHLTRAPALEAVDMVEIKDSVAITEA